MPHEQDVQEEQQFLDRAHEGLEEMRADAARMLRSALDVGRGGTFQSRTERDIVVRTSMARLAQLDIGDQALCFGRIDRAPEAAHPVGESFHIGRLAVSADDLEPLVVDWRAPVAEPFYRATGLDPQGLVRRRHLAVAGHIVTDVEDECFAAPSGVGAQGVAPPGVPAPAPAQGIQGDVSGNGHGGLDAGGVLHGPGPGGVLHGPGPGGVLHGPDADGLLELGGPGALLAAIDGARSGHMADIVATIQREQDETIRSPLGGVLLVQGGPGTGKTAVALHRAAYLLYTHRFPLERQGVLVVGPNPLFLRYIERVLPSLGETGVTLSTVSGLVPEIRVRADEDPVLAHLKGEARMAAFVARAVRTRQRPLRHDVEIPYGATTLRLLAADTEHVVSAARRRRGPHNTRRRYVEHRVLQLLAEQYDRTRRRSGAAGTPSGGGDGEQMGGAELAERRHQLRQLPAVAEALDRMWPRLSPHELLHDLYGARPLLAAAGHGVLTDAEIASLHRPRSGSLDRVPWTAADAALVDEARALLGPRRRPRPRPDARERVELAREEVGFWPVGLSAVPAPVSNGHRAAAEDEVRSFGHIVVDEAQDLSPMQLRMLARRSISGSMTVVGDIAQATGTWSLDGWEDVATHLAPGRTPRVVELTIGYRTPAEVMEVAAGVLAVAAPGLTPPRPVRRSGTRPVRIQVPRGSLAEGAAAAAAREVAAAGEGRTAVLTPAGLLGPVTAALAGLGMDPVDPRDASGPGLAAPLVVLPAAESHGLEFDAVVVVEPAAIAAGPDWDGEVAPPGAAEPAVAGLRALYVALTRPTRRLTVVHSAPLPDGLELP